MSDLTRKDYKRILYEEMGWTDKLEKLEKSEKEGAVSSSSLGSDTSNVQAAKGS